MSVGAGFVSRGSELGVGWTPNRPAGQRGTRARSLRCERSEDGDGATGRSFSNIDSGRMHDSLDFAVGPTEGRG